MSEQTNVRACAHTIVLFKLYLNNFFQITFNFFTPSFRSQHCCSRIFVCMSLSIHATLALCFALRQCVCFFVDLQLHIIYLNNKILFVYFQQCHIFFNIICAVDWCACVRACVRSSAGSHSKASVSKLLWPLFPMAKNARGWWNDSWHIQ